MPLNDYWNNILGAQGRGWGQWRPPGEETSMSPTWAQSSGYGRRNGWSPTGAFAQDPQTPSFRLQTGSAAAPPMGQASTVPQLNPMQMPGMMSPGQAPLGPYYPPLAPMPFPDSMTIQPVAPTAPMMGRSLSDPGRLSWLGMLRSRDV